MSSTGSVILSPRTTTTTTSTEDSTTKAYDRAVNPSAGAESSTAESGASSPKAEGTTTTGSKQPSTWAAVTRSSFGTLAFLFKRPIRLFRPVKISTWTGIQAIAEEQGRTVTPSFVRGLIRTEGWRFLPRHILPPLLVNTCIGLTLFTTYTTSEQFLTPHFSSTLIPFISGSIAGASQSLISAPLDNARLLLLRRQRQLRLHGRKAVKGGTPFVSWFGLLRDAVFGAGEVAGGGKIVGRAKKGWSLMGLSLGKDAMGFGVFFWVFEFGRKRAREFGLRWDGIGEEEVVECFDPERGEEWDWEEKEDEGRGGKRRRSGLSLVGQSLGILISGGLAGWCFALVARPFERVRGVLYEGRLRWVEREVRIKEWEEREERRRKAVDGEEGERKRGRGDRRSAARVGGGGAVGKGPVRVKKRRVRGVGRIFNRTKRRKIKASILASRARHWARRPTSSSTTSSAPSFSTTKPFKPVHHPLPSSISLIQQAAKRYGTWDFFFAPLPVLKRQDARLSHSTTTMKSLPFGGGGGGVGVGGLKGRPTTTTTTTKSGPTRLSARGRMAKDAVERSRGWRFGMKVLVYIPPYSVGFLAYALMSGDLK